MVTAGADSRGPRRTAFRRSLVVRLAALVGAIAVVAGLTLQVTPAPQATADGPKATAGDCALDGSVTTGAIFNNPQTDPGRIHRHIGCMIDGAPEGAKINIAGYHFADETMTSAVIKAIRNGVQVRIVVDGNIGHYPDDPKHLTRVQAAIDEVGDGKSSIKKCPTNEEKGDYGCIANRRMHNKLVTLSETHGTQHVTFLTSSNYEDNDGEDGTDNSGMGMWNSGYTAANDEPLYHWFADNYFNDLASGEENLSYYEDHDDVLDKPIGNYRVFHSPRADGITALTDALNKIDCHGSTSGGTDPGHRTIVRVAMWTISDTGGYGLEIAKKLWSLDNAGCYVDVVADGIGDKKGNYASLRALLQQPIPANDERINYHGPEVREFNSGQPHGLHEKNLMIDGTFDDKINQKVVFTGSYNFTQSSAANPSDKITVNDETWLQINDAGVHDRFVDNFVDVRNAAHTCWQTSKPTACDGGRSDIDLTDPLNCHETADKYASKHLLYLYRGTKCDGANDGKADGSDSDYDDGKGQIEDLDNAVDSIVNTTTKTIKFYNYPRYNDGHPEGDSFCLRPGAWINRISWYGDGSSTWSNSISSHRVLDDPEKDCDRWFGGYHEPNR
ncbi:phospholipase D-like domain-containing protein [Microlunatus soli]|uniref:phospholipase D n=1 Tax=Microlunatus soli TaxID=630515 RepID=A0A1H1TZS7_9ACTN|nr:phospholipase D-like domain-containing protein [Microlunatus soli]SDS65760.1 Phosphatidylserine/phosphatidylglycerophosphate/cardiolipin synthase [Microlunatus soli]